MFGKVAGSGEADGGIGELLLKEALGEELECLAGFGEDEGFGFGAPLELEAGGEGGNPDLADGGLGGENELGGAILEENVEDAVLFLGFEPALFLGVDEGLLEIFQGGVGDAAKLGFINHGEVSLAWVRILGARAEKGCGMGSLSVVGIAWLMLAGGGAGASTGVATGYWIGPTKSIVRVEACGSEVCLKVVKLPADAPATVDIHNPDAALRTRPLCGRNIGTGFHETSPGKLEDGRLYDPTSGKTYKGTVTVVGNKLKLRGYVGVGLFGRSETWVRVGTVGECEENAGK